jgi:hypothetical protein
VGLRAETVITLLAGVMGQGLEFPEELGKEALFCPVVEREPEMA